jgi:hypothetical protein
MSYKTNGAFKMNRSFKRMLCLMKDQNKANDFKKLFISAQCAEEASKKKSFKNEGSDSE